MTRRAELDELLKSAMARVDAMTPEARAAMYREQRRNYILSEMEWGDDEDEAAFRAAFERGDTAEMQRLEAEGKERRAAAERYLKETGL